MAQLVGITNSTFDAALYRREVCDNHGETLTTDGVLEGLSVVAKAYDDNPDKHWLTAMKETPFYISKAVK